jgi:hypothetical protein
MRVLCARRPERTSPQAAFDEPVDEPPRHRRPGECAVDDRRTERIERVIGTQDAFLSGTSVRLRIGAALILATAAVAAHQHPDGR